jgi:hypothetical protein
MLDQSLGRRLREIQDAKAGEETAAEPPVEAPVEQPPAPAPPARTPLGRLLVEKGMLSEDDLDLALERQQAEGRPLGQILLDMGAVTEQNLARSVTEQHGLDSEASLRRRIAAEGEQPAEPAPAAPERAALERYVVREGTGGEPLYSAGSFLDAADVAFELIEERDPDALEIVRLGDGDCEQLWSYSRDAEPDQSS